VQLVLQARREQQVQLDLLVQLVIQVLLAQLVQLVRLVQQVQLDLLVLRVIQARQGQLALQGHKAFKAM
jgi:hypothetical protein